VLSDKSAHRLFGAACCVGGRAGWFRANWMWWLRGALTDSFRCRHSRGRRSIPP
jgi:hypothetical protein